MAYPDVIFRVQDKTDGSVTIRHAPCEMLGVDPKVSGYEPVKTDTRDAAKQVTERE
jgi:hypothetical protein